MFIANQCRGGIGCLIHISNENQQLNRTTDEYFQNGKKRLPSKTLPTLDYHAVSKN